MKYPHKTVAVVLGGSIIVLLSIWLLIACSISPHCVGYSSYNSVILILQTQKAVTMRGVFTTTYLVPPSFGESGCQVPRVQRQAWRCWLFESLWSAGGDLYPWGSAGLRLLLNLRLWKNGVFWRRSARHTTFGIEVENNFKYTLLYTWINFTNQWSDIFLAFWVAFRLIIIEI